MARSKNGPKPEPLFTLEEVAKAAQVSVRHLRNEIARGNLVARNLGRVVRIAESEYRRWAGTA